MNDPPLLDASGSPVLERDNVARGTLLNELELIAGASANYFNQSEADEALDSKRKKIALRRLDRIVMAMQQLYSRVSDEYFDLKKRFLA